MTAPATTEMLKLADTIDRNSVRIIGAVDYFLTSEQQVAIVVALRQAASVRAEVAGEAVYQFRQRSGVGKGPQSLAPWGDWCSIEREDYERYIQKPSNLIEVRALASPSRSKGVSLVEVQIEEAVCPNCHDANSCGDYQGPTCEVCNGTGRAAQKSEVLTESVLEALATRLREAAHFCTEMTELERHCREVADELMRLPAQKSEVRSREAICQNCNGTKRALYFSEQGMKHEKRECHMCRAAAQKFEVRSGAVAWRWKYKPQDGWQYCGTEQVPPREAIAERLALLALDAVQAGEADHWIKLLDDGKAVLSKNEMQEISQVLLRLRGAAQEASDCGDDEGRMEKISALIARLQSTLDRWGDTCVYIRRGGLAWGAVALNRQADDKKHGVFDLQAQHDRDMEQRVGQVERLIADRNRWMERAMAAEASSAPSANAAQTAPIRCPSCGKVAQAAINCTSCSSVPSAECK